MCPVHNLTYALFEKIAKIFLHAIPLHSNADKSKAVQRNLLNQEPNKNISRRVDQIIRRLRRIVCFHLGLRPAPLRPHHLIYVCCRSRINCEWSTSMFKVTTVIPAQVSDELRRKVYYMCVCMDF